jgi:hypothetical protein
MNDELPFCLFIFANFFLTTTRKRVLLISPLRGGAKGKESNENEEWPVMLSGASNKVICNCIMHRSCKSFCQGEGKMFTSFRNAGFAANFTSLENITKSARKLASWGLVAIIGIMPSAANAGYMGISSAPETSQIQPGQVYKLRVVADSTTVPSDTIMAASWSVYVPTGVTITGAELPSQNNPSTNPNDFFLRSANEAK